MKTSVELSKSLSEIRSLRLTARGGPALAGVPSPGEAANKKNPPEMVDFFVEMHSSWREPRFWFGADS